MKDNIISLIDTIIDNFTSLKILAPQLEEIGSTWLNALKAGNKIIFCGNGGSAADAQHLSAELVGRYIMERPSLPAISLTTDTSALTAIANDYGYDCVFSRQLSGVGKPGDVLTGISTSGNSPNIIKAFEFAKEINITTVAFTGASGGKLKQLADYCLSVPSTITNNIQEMHIACGHILCGLVEKELYASVQK